MGIATVLAVIFVMLVAALYARPHVSGWLFTTTSTRLAPVKGKDRISQSPLNETILDPASQPQKQQDPNRTPNHTLSSPASPVPNPTTTRSVGVRVPTTTPWFLNRSFDCNRSCYERLINASYPDCKQHLQPCEVFWGAGYPLTRPRPKDDFFTQIMLDLVRAFIGMLESNGILYRLAWGGLLGALRNGGIIPWTDDDLDMTVLAGMNQGEALLASHFNNTVMGWMGAEDHMSIGNKLVSQRCKQFYNNTAFKGLQPWNLDTHWERKKKGRTQKCAPVCRCQFYDMELNCPVDAIRVLDGLYSNWEKPSVCNQRLVGCRERNNTHRGRPLYDLPPEQDYGPNSPIDSVMLAQEYCLLPWRRPSTDKNFCRFGFMPSPKNIKLKPKPIGRGRFHKIHYMWHIRHLTCGMEFL